MRIGYQGIKGSYSHIATNYTFPKSQKVGYSSFANAFEALGKGEVDKILMPVENTIIGSINETYDLIFKNKFWIEGEVTLKIDHNLLAPSGSKLKEIKRVYSHPKALEQCKSFFKNNLHIDGIEYEDTALAAGFVSIKQDKKNAAIASMHAAYIYNLEIISKRIQDSKKNYTRFFLIGNEENKQEGGKSTLVFSTNHKPGSLIKALQTFSAVNLTHIESRPMPDKPWKYLFYLEFEYKKSDKIESLLDELSQYSDYVRLLGTYPKGNFIKEAENSTKLTVVKM